MNSQLANSIGGARTILTENAPRVADIPGQLDALEKATVRIADATKHLEARLQPVIRQLPATEGKGDPAVPEACICPVADSVRSKVNSLHRVADVLESLAREVEL